MSKIAKPADRGRLSAGEGWGASANYEKNPTIIARKNQLFGVFDHDSKNAVIILGSEVSDEHL